MQATGKVSSPSDLLRTTNLGKHKQEKLLKHLKMLSSAASSRFAYGCMCCMHWPTGLPLEMSTRDPSCRGAMSSCMTTILPTLHANTASLTVTGKNLRLVPQSLHEAISASLQIRTFCFLSRMSASSAEQLYQLCLESDDAWLHRPANAESWSMTRPSHSPQQDCSCSSWIEVSQFYYLLTTDAVPFKNTVGRLRDCLYRALRPWNYC